MDEQTFARLAYSAVKNIGITEREAFLMPIRKLYLLFDAYIESVNPDTKNTQKTIEHDGLMPPNGAMH